MTTKHIFVTGGVVSSLGKGITAAGLGQLLKSRGFDVMIQKFDPYLNVDPGMMSPYQHGEVFVTEDGAETDLDLGHYERFIDLNLNENCSVSAGKIYWSVLNKERTGDYEGATIQVIPHITNEIGERMLKTGIESEADIVITEIGGTVGDIESLPFLEAIRQVKHKVGKDNSMFIHLTLIPYLKKAEELKTKPTQHSVKELRGLGIQPDLLICRTELPLNDSIKDKIALFCDLEPEEVIDNVDVSNIYEIPIMLEEKGLPELVLNHLGLESKKEVNLDSWKDMVETLKSPKDNVKIALVGKYVELKDAYLSLAEALNHGAIDNKLDLELEWIHSEGLEDKDIKSVLQDADGIIVPSGFGERGTPGMRSAVRYARENKIPFFGLGMGMQMAVVEFARNVLGLEGADSIEINPKTKHPIITGKSEIEGESPEMRLGTYPCHILEETKAFESYGKKEIFERHRHRYEFNLEYKELFEENGFIVSGMSPDEKLVEIMELKDHPWFVGVQYHAEFKSRPINAHPLFKSFIGKAYEYKNN